MIRFIYVEALRKGRGLGVRTAVLVQVMRDEECSGVAFGCDPRNGDLDRAIIEAVPGACADLVDGKTDPDRWVLSRSNRQLLESRRGDATQPHARGELLSHNDLDTLLNVLGNSIWISRSTGCDWSTGPMR